MGLGLFNGWVVIHGSELRAFSPPNFGISNIADVMTYFATLPYVFSGIYGIKSIVSWKTLYKCMNLGKVLNRFEPCLAPGRSRLRKRCT